MKTLYLILIFLVQINVFAAEELKVFTKPSHPVAGEPFDLVFVISSKVDAIPSISFNAPGADVVNRRREGVTQTTTFINGRLSTKREVTYVYELIVPIPKTLLISSIKVNLDGNIIKHRNLVVNILKTPRIKPPVFVMAVPTKTNVFAGEGLTVTYFLYSKAPLLSLDILEFPKLSGFLKRYYDKRKIADEQVQYEGDIYRRVYLYSARLFPEKNRTLKIDPMKIRITYRSGRGASNNFGFGMNFGFGRVQTKTLSSKPIRIKVMPLPTDNIPPSFTGLVGKHDFKLTLPKKKFLVNEAIEAKLEVFGPGALEKLDAVKILENDSLEEFETKVDLTVNFNDTARKVFDYTFLARSNFEIPEKEVAVSYFDPKTVKYVTEFIKIDKVTASGGSMAAVQPSQHENDKTSVPKVEKQDKIINKNLATGIVAPDFEPGFIKNNIIRVINVVLVFLLIAYLLTDIKKIMRFRKQKSLFESVLEDIKNSGFDYSKIHKLFFYFAQAKSKKLKDVDKFNTRDILKSAKLSKNAESYFMDIINNCEEESYFNKKGKDNLQFAKKFFDELSSRLNESNKVVS